VVQRGDNPRSIYHDCHTASVHRYICAGCIMCKNTYTEHSELTKLRCSFPRTILRCNFSPKLLRWTLSASLKCFAVKGFHPPPVKQDAEDWATELGTTQPALCHGTGVVPAVRHPSRGQGREWSPRGAARWQGGHCKPKAAMVQSLLGDSEGTVPATSLLCAGRDGALSTSSGGLWKLCWCRGHS